MKVEQYIQDLLYRYDCVVIPEFGAFLTHRKSARILEDGKAFYPPRKVVSFNHQLTENDGILINYIASVEKITYQEAMLKLRQFTKQLFLSLHQDKKVVFENIGSFSLEKDKVLFQPKENQNYLPESFGLSNFTAQPQTAQTTAKVISVKEKETTIAQETNTKTRPLYWRYAAIGAVAIGIAGFLSANWYSNEVKNHNLVEQQKAAQEVEQKIQHATFSITNPLPEITFKAPSPAVGKYHIVAGAFRQKENADKKLQQLQAEGFKAKAIGTNKYGLHQIIYSSYTGRLEALQALRKIKNTQNAQAWLLVKEL